MERGGAREIYMYLDRGVKKKGMGKRGGGFSKVALVFMRSPPLGIANLCPIAYLLGRGRGKMLS